MTFDSAQLLPLIPEIAVLVLASILLLVDLWLKEDDKGKNHVIAVFGLLAVIGLTGVVGGGAREIVLGGTYVRDPMSDLLKIAILGVSLLSFVYAKDYLQERRMLVGEYYVLTLTAVLGMMVMVSANSFMTLYLGLELLALSLYALVAFNRDSPSGAEAAMKYFVLGALGSGLLLYGLSMLYGATGSLELGAVARAVAWQGADNQVLVFGLVFVVIGIGFKFGAVPFHMWVPDVYQGAPTAATLLIASAPKIAAFGMTIRVLVEGLLGLAVDWQQMLVVLSVCSLVVGNLAAIAQTNFKRMLAYSTIAQMGFMMLGLVSGVVNGNTLSAANAYSSAMFYMITYVVTTLGTFGLIMLMARQGFEADEISDFAGLNQRSPLLAGVAAIFMFSLAGIPPTVGFYAKLSVLQALISTNDSFYLGLAIFAVVLSLIGAFYYLRIVKVMYFDPATDTQPIVAVGSARAVLSLNGAAVLVLGILPGGLMAMCAHAIVKTLAT